MDCGDGAGLASCEIALLRRHQRYPRKHGREPAIAKYLAGSPAGIYLTTTTFPIIPSPSCRTQMNGNVPVLVKVTRNLVTVIGDWGRPVRSCGAAMINPECTLSLGELITACSAPSASRVTLLEGGTGFGGSAPNVTVCGVTGSFGPLNRLANMDYGGVLKEAHH